MITSNLSAGGKPGLLSRLLISSTLLSSYEKLTKQVSHRLLQTCDIHLPGVDVESQDDELVFQLVLACVGVEVQEMWGLSDKYRPDLIREPYLSLPDINEFSTHISEQMLKNIHIVVEDMKESVHMKAYLLDLKGIFESLVNNIRKEEDMVLI